MPTQTIYKHWFGLLVIFFIGGGLMVALLFAGWYGLVPQVPLQVALYIVVVLIGIITLERIIVYTKNRIILSASGIEYRKYSTLFFSDFASADWNTVQSIDVHQGSIFAKIFGYGDLLVQTSDARPLLGMTMIERADAWKQYINENATVGKVGGA